MQGRRARLAPLATAALLLSGPAWPGCAPRVYGVDAARRVVLVSPSGAATPAPRHVFLDGCRGRLDEPSSPVRCSGDAQLGVQDEANANANANAPAPVAWPGLPLTETDTHFDSAAARLVGRLIERQAPPAAPPAPAPGASAETSSPR